jgi:predicted nucleic acid-binding protein
MPAHEVREPPPRGAWLPQRALLDVNVWIALLDDAHQFSEEANAFIDSPEARIATSPLVENGVIRIIWPDDVSLRDDTLVDFSRVQGHQQVTDLYLLALAVRHGGRLVTFDRAVALSSVRGATAEHLLVL